MMRILIGFFLFYMAFQALAAGHLFLFLILFVFSAWTFLNQSQSSYTHRRSPFQGFWGGGDNVPPEPYLQGFNQIFLRYGQSKAYVFLALVASNAYLLVKVDGRVTEEEMTALRESLIRHFGQNLNHNLVKDVIEFTRTQIGQPQASINFQDYMAYNAYIFNHYLMSSLSSHDRQVYLILYFQILYEIVYANQLNQPQELALIQFLEEYFNLPHTIIQHIRQMAYYSSQTSSSRYQYGRNETYFRPNREDELQKAWQLFGLHPGSSREEIKKSFRRLAKEYHPDRYTGMPEELQNKAKEKFQQINNAYELLLKEVGG
ncbi:MAG: DnaJ domain-containing protein [Candidatus Delongbacteria bacterium]|nr:DnaJ domain-containing protein [Candidatus Delongbacteria bacterium]